MASNTTSPTAATTPDPYGGRGPTALGVGYALFIVATVLMAMRYYVRFGMGRPANWPLIWLTISYVGGVLALICVTIDAKLYGMGNHLKVLLEAGTVEDCILWIWISLFFELSCIATGKAAAASLLISIQGNTKPLARTFLWSLAAFNMVMDGIVMIALWFQCDPVAKLWNQELLGTCNAVRTIEYLGITAGCINAVSDVIFAIYPTYIVYHLNMPRRLKLGLCSLMGLGVFSGVSAAIKTSELPTMQVTSDPTYAIASLVIWGLAESWVIVIVACIPPTWPIVQAYLDKRNGSRLSISKDSRGKPVYLSGGHDYNNLRGGDTKTLKSKGYVDHTTISLPNEGSTADLPSNIIMMRHEISVRQDTASVTEAGHSDSSPSRERAYSNSRTSDGEVSQ